MYGKGVEIESYRDLIVWQASVELAVACYTITTEFPKQEMFGLVAQIRRSSVSIASNIAEGHGRETGGHFVNFLRIAQGSLKELETQLLISQRVGLIAMNEKEALDRQCADIGKMLRSLIRSLQGNK